MGLSLSLGLQLGGVVTRSTGGGVVYEPETEALVARFTTAPTTQRKGLINDLIKSLKSSGIWVTQDEIAILASHDAQAARRNWIGDRYNLTPVSAPVFTVDRGYIGDGSAARLASGFNPSTAAGKFSLNSASLWAYIVSEGAENASDVGGGGASIVIIQSRRAAGQADADINNAQSATLRTAVASALGLTAASRTASNVVKLFRGSGLIATTSTPSTALPSGGSAEITVLGQNAVSFSTKRIAACGWGAGLTDTQVADLNAALTTYLSAVGAI